MMVGTATDGQTVTNIGLEKVDRYFFSNADLTKINTISAAVDPVKNLSGMELC